MTKLCWSAVEHGKPFPQAQKRKMVTLYPARVQAIRERDGIRNNPNFLPADTAIPANTHICKVYSAILDDIDRYDRLLAYPESRAIYRIVEEVYKKVLSKTLETVRGHNSNHEWVNNQEEELRVLKKRLDFHETRTKETKLSRATPIELLCRLVATISAKPEWSIGKSLASWIIIILDSFILFV
jgi:hypothetical protein